MTAFVTTDLPASVNTVEKLAVWTASVLNYLYPDDTATEAAGVAQRTCQAGPVEITAVSPTVWRHISRLSIPLNRNWIRDGEQWEQAQDIGSSAIPAEFKV